MENKNSYLNIKNVIILLLIAVILLLRFCSGNNVPTEPIVKTTVVETIHYDTIRDTIPEYVPQWIDRFPPPDTIWKDRDVDTAFILQDYFATYFYSDTLHLDSLTLVVSDSVTQNNISSREISYRLLYPTKTITITNDRYLNRREYYAGFGIAGSTTGFEFVGFDFIFKTKKDMTYRATAGINEQLGVQLGFGMHWRLKLMK